MHARLATYYQLSPEPVFGCVVLKRGGALEGSRRARQGQLDQDPPAHALTKPLP